MDTVVTYVSEGHILVNGILYKRKKTVAGRYSREARAAYMRQWRQRKADASNNID